MIPLTEIAELIGVDYDGTQVMITAMNTLKEAGADELSFVSSAKYARDLSSTGAAAVIVSKEDEKNVPEQTVALVVDEPYLMMAKVSRLFAKPIEEKGAPAPVIGENTRISEKATLENGAVIGKNCRILPGVYIGANVTIGDNTVVYPNAAIYRDTVIGNDCIIHAGTVIGSDGFGFAHTKTGEHVKIYQNGNVVIEDDVEIGSSCTIDSAAFGSTLIKTGSKIDNLVQIGHNCIIGEYSIIVSQVGISGSTTLGRNVVMGGQSATAGHLEIAPFTTLAARSGVTKSIKEGGKTYSGFPLMEHRLWLKLQGKLAQLLK
jgi:UDP-3-O-[3-hydroxymyristoyl] glucosamine N-acyltransferase